MISGTFHPISQEWRYFSREKAIVHTLHLAELDSSNSGNTVLIAKTPPVGKQTSGPGGAPMQLPPAPYFGANAKIITNSSLIITCYGSTNYLGQITAQKHMGIQVSDTQIIMTPEESGYFVVHAEAQGDEHNLVAQGPNNDGKITLQIFAGGDLIAQSIWELYMVGQTAGHYLIRIPRTSCEAMFPGTSFTARLTGLGAKPTSYLSMWCMKIADFG